MLIAHSSAQTRAALADHDEESEVTTEGLWRRRQIGLAAGRGKLLALSERDPRVYFAAERTLLAWVRTGVTIIGLGFVVARFGLFLRLVNSAQPDDARLGFSALLGVSFAIGGGALTALAALQFALFVRHMKPEELPQPRLTHYVSLVLALAVSCVGGVLAVYLLR
jgi:putative membrane protein